MTRSKRPPGRPPKDTIAMLEPITIRLPGPMVRQIDKLRETRLDAPDKSTLIRELIAKALKAEGLPA